MGLPTLLPRIGLAGFVQQPRRRRLVWLAVHRQRRRRAYAQAVANVLVTELRGSHRAIKTVAKGREPARGRPRTGCRDAEVPAARI